MKYMNVETFETSDLVFGAPEEGKLPDGKEFKMIPISVQHPDNSVGPLVIATKPCFSFGVQKDFKYNTYTLPIVLYDRDGRTAGQRAFIKVIQKIQSVCNLKPKSCLYGSEERPTMYPKLVYSKCIAKCTALPEWLLGLIASLWLTPLPFRSEFTKPS